jgi:hypothetical protein
MIVSWDLILTSVWKLLVSKKGPSSWMDNLGFWGLGFSYNNRSCDLIFVRFWFFAHEEWCKDWPNNVATQFPCAQVSCHILLERSWQRLQLCFGIHLNQRFLHPNLWASKVVRASILGISELPLWSPGTKWHLGVGPMAMHKEYYKGEGDGFPQVRAVVSLVSPWSPMVRPCTKGVSTMH